MAYHSTLNDKKEYAEMCGCFKLPVKTSVRGPAPLLTSGEDIIDETIHFARANLMMANFEVKGAADRVLMYLTLFISAVIQRASTTKNRVDGQKTLIPFAQESFSAPGDSGFPLGGFFPAPANQREADDWKAYFRQLREETVVRLMDRLYNPDGSLNKWWMSFSKKKFMGKSL